MNLKKAQRKQVKLRMNISAPSGGGKTHSALLLAYGFTQNWDKIALIDTENGSGSLYDHLGSYNVLDLDPPHTNERYIEAIEACEKAGIEFCIIDSASHAWSNLLDNNEMLASSKYRGNSWSAWSQSKPRQRKFLDAILNSKMHIITCTRSKTETIMGDDKKVKKVGMKDQQQDGWEYEFTLSLNLDRDTHMAIVSKDRTNLFEGRDPFVITKETGTLVKKWCEQGGEAEKKEILNSSHPKWFSVLKALEGDYVVSQVKGKYDLDEGVEEILNEHKAKKMSTSPEIISLEKEKQRILNHIQNAKDLPNLALIDELIGDDLELNEAYNIQFEKLS